MMSVSPKLPEGVFTFFDVSTMHVTERDCALIQRCGFPLVVYGYDHGYFVHCGTNEADDEKNLRDAGMSEGFINVWKKGVANGCWFIRLDADGSSYQEFERFDW